MIGFDNLPGSPSLPGNRGIGATEGLAGRHCAYRLSCPNRCVFLQVFSYTVAAVTELIKGSVYG